MVEHDGTAASSPVTSCRTSRPPDTPKAPMRLPMGMATPGHHPGPIASGCGARGGQQPRGTWAAGGARGGARRNGRAGAHDPPHRPDIHCIPGTQHHTPPWPAGWTHGTPPIAPVEATASSLRARYAAVGGQYGAQLTARDAPCARRRTKYVEHTIHPVRAMVHGDAVHRQALKCSGSHAFEHLKQGVICTKRPTGTAVNVSVAREISHESTHRATCW